MKRRGKKSKIKLKYVIKGGKNKPENYKEKIEIHFFLIKKAFELLRS